MLEQVDPSKKSSGLKETLESRRAVAAEGPRLDVRRVDPAKMEADFALESLDVLHRGGPVDDQQRFVLEAIVMPYHRPVVDIVDNRMRTDQLTSEWQSLAGDALRPQIEQCLWSIGRIDVPKLPSLPYAGTGFIVGPDLLMTNRHVANIFAQGVGIRTINFQPGQAAAVDFYHENGGTRSESLAVERVLMIHPYWDMALLKVKGLPENRKPLTLSITDPSSLLDREIVVVGYPGYDPTEGNEFQQTQNRIFRGIYYVKRLQPGRLKAREPIESFHKTVEAATHDSSTLGGNSGSAVLLLPRAAGETIQVVGLHFAGEYLVANFAVPMSDLAQDSLVVDAGVNFASRSAPRDDFYASWWREADSAEAVAAAGAVSAGPSVQLPRAGTPVSSPVSKGPVSWTIPLEITVSLGAPAVSAPAAATVLPSPAAAPPMAVEGLFFRNRTSPTAASPQQFSVASLAADEFQWPTALSLALASRLAYEDAAAVENTARSVWKLNQCKFVEADDTHCFVATSADAALVAFRGTESVGNWLTDLDIAGTTRPYGVVHRGFLAAFQVVDSQLRELLAGLPQRRVLLTGHSLGGALATVAAAEWCGQIPISSVYTYGQPAVGRGEFPAFMNQQHAGKFFRFVNNDDIVPRVPPCYIHVGRLFHFDAQGRLESQAESALCEAAAAVVPHVVVSPEEPPMVSEAEFDRLRAQLLQQRLWARASGLESLEAPMIEGFLPSISDHSIDQYIAKIAAKT
jgi:V8-like Glu-specific endopeptidase